MDWTEADTQIGPLLTHPDHWPRIRQKLEQRQVTMLALVGEDPARPSAIQADSDRSGWRIAGVDWTRLDPVGTPSKCSSKSSTRPAVRLARLGRLGTASARRDAGTADTRKRPPTQANPEGRAPLAPRSEDRKRSTPDSTPSPTSTRGAPTAARSPRNDGSSSGV